MPPLTEILAEKDRRRRAAEHKQLAEEAEAVRERCRSLAGFIREAWHVLLPNTTYVHGWHIDAVCEHLEAVHSRQILRLMINEPPGMMKSLIASVFFPAWEWTQQPELQYLTASYSKDYSQRDSRANRDLVQSEWYRNLWPNLVLSRDGETNFANTQGGFRMAMPFGSLTGGRGNRVILDDPHSVANVESDAERKEAVRLFRESLPSRVNDQRRDAIIVIMHRLHPKDICGVIEDLGLDYEKLILAMEFEPERRYTTSIGWTDPRQEPGELLFPERFPAGVVARLKSSGELSSHAYAGQYQQRPSAREGGMFKRHWFKIVDAIPAEARRKVRRWDLAGTEDGIGDPDWTASVKMATAGDGRFFIEDAYRMRERGAAVRRAIQNAAAADGRTCEIVIPQDPGQAGKDQAASIIGENAGYRISAERETGSKETRAEPLAAQCEAGNVYLLRAAWNEPFIDELCAFPQGHDDWFDAAAGAFNKLASVRTMLISDSVLARSAQRGVR